MNADEFEQRHLVGEPGWVIEARGGGSFRVDCVCGWEEGGFDTSSLARAAGFAHSTGKRGGAPARGPGPSGGRSRRWWRRS